MGDLKNKNRHLPKISQNHFEDFQDNFEEISAPGIILGTKTKNESKIHSQNKNPPPSKKIKVLASQSKNNIDSEARDIPQIDLSSFASQIKMMNIAGSGENET